MHSHLTLGIASAVFTSLFFSSSVMAEPTGGNIAGGAGHIHRSGLNTNIHQHTDRLAIDWDTFNIERNETVNFEQPDRSSIVLNRIRDINPSQIQGAISANGNVILANPNGIFFGSDSSVNVGGLFAAAMSIDPQDFMEGDFSFQALQNTGGLVANEGTLKVLDGGTLALLGQRIKNTGLLIANFGTVFLAAEGTISVSLDQQNNNVNIGVTQQRLAEILELDSPEILNEGLIQAFGGRVILTARQANDIRDTIKVIDENQLATRIIVQNGVTYLAGADGNISDLGGIDVSNNEGDAGYITYDSYNILHKGTIKADSLIGKGGSVTFNAENTTLLADNSSVSAQSQNSRGGDVKVLGNQVGLTDKARIDVSGAQGGGEILIGGDFQGKNKNIKNAEAVYLGEETRIKADAIEKGDGGKVIVWSDDRTRAYGTLSATGGKQSGDGGFIETSSKNYADLQTRIDVSAINGQHGEWLIDPSSIDIDNGSGNGGVLEITPPSGSNPGSTIFQSTINDSSIDVDFLQTTLVNGANITIQTSVIDDPDLNREDSTDPINSYGDITLSVDLDFDNAGKISNEENASSLTLRAHRNIIIDGRIYDSNGDNLTDPLDNSTFEPDGDILNLTLIADWGGNGETNQRGTPGIGSVRINNNINLQGGNFTASGVDFIQAANTIIDTRIPLEVLDVINTTTPVLTPEGRVTITVQNNATLGNITTRTGTGKGNLSVTATNANSAITQVRVLDDTGNITGSSTLTIAGTTNLSANGLINVSNTGNDFTGAVSATNGSTVTLKDINDLTLGNITGVDTLNATAIGAINQQTATTLSTTGTEASFTAGTDITLAIANNTDTALELNAGNNATLSSTGGITIGTSTIGNDLNVTAGGDITDAGVIGVINTATFNAAKNAITLNNNTHTLNNVQITSAGAVQINEADNINIAGDMASLTVTSGLAGAPSTVSNITDSTLNVTGTSTFNLVNGGDLILDNFANANRNNLEDTITLTNNTLDTVRLRNASEISFSALNIGSDLALNALGDISQSGAFTVAGTTSLQGSNITLNNDNDFNGVSIASAGRIEITELNNIQLQGTMDSLKLTTGTGGATSTIENINGGVLNVTQATEFIFENGGDLNLNNNATHNLSGPISVTSLSGDLNNVDINNNAGVNLSASPIQNDLTINSNGDINQTGAWTVVGLTTLDSNNNVITLNQANDLNQLTVSNATTVSVNDINDGVDIIARNISATLDIDATDTVNLQGDAGALNIVTTAGGIFDSDTIMVSGNTTLNAANSDIVFDTTTNRFNNITITQANNVTLNNQLSIQIAGTMNTATLTAGLEGNLSRITNINARALNVAGQSNFALANGGDIILDNNAIHGLQGEITISATAGPLNNVRINNAFGVNLRALTIQGNLDIIANGNITQTGAFVVNGNTTLASLNNLIDLGLNNDFNRIDISNASNVSLNDTNNGLDVIANAISGTLEIEATGLVRLQGNAAALDVSTTAGGIEDSAALNIAGNTQLDSANADIVFNDNTNLNTLTITQANNALLFDIDALILNAINITDNLNVTAGSTLTLAGTMGSLNGTSITGGIVGSGAISVSGNAQLNAGNANITLNTFEHDLNTLTVVNARNVNINDVNAVAIAATNINGTLTATTGDTLTLSGKMNDLIATVTPTQNALGGIIDNGPLQISNRAQLDAGGGQINLSNAANDFNLMAISNASEVNITDANALNITASEVSGATALIANNTVNISGTLNDLSITTRGNIQNGTGALITKGLTSLDAGNSDINLTHAGNDFNGLGITSARDVTLNDVTGIRLQSINSRDFTLTTGNDISQSTGTAIKSTRTASINAGNADINLSGDNSFITLTLAAKSATVVNYQALILNDSTLTNSLDLTTQNGNLSINRISATDTVRLTAAAALVNLNGANDNLVTNSASLQASTGIGNNTQINTRVSTLQALNTNTGNINITNTGTRITLDSIVNSGIDTGDFNLRTGGDVFINNITLRQDLRQAFLTNNPSDSGTGTVNMFSTRGSFLGVGEKDIKAPDIRATNLLIIGLNGTLGTITRPIVLDISGKVELALRATLDPVYIDPIPAPADIRDESLLPFISANVLNTVNGLALIDVENLLDIDPAIFTDIRHFVVTEDAVKLPRDQWFEGGYTIEEDEEYFRQVTGEAVIGHGEY